MHGMLVAVNRRNLIGLLGGAAAWPVAARAQQPSRRFRVGFLGPGSAGDLPQRMEAFRAGLRALGYQEGRDFVIEFRWADGHYDRLPALVADLVGANVDVIVTHGTPGVLAAKQGTPSIPIVMAVVGDALGSGLVSSLARPGANVTGLTFFQPELVAKRIELLKEIVPGLRNVGAMLNLANPMNEPVLPQIAQLAQSLKLEIHQFDVRDRSALEGAFAAMAAKRVDGLVIFDDAVLLANAGSVAALALKQRLPSSGWADFALEGGLIAYGVNFPDMFRRAAWFVDKILKGAKPGELPIERASRFETIVNLKTAKAIGIELPTATLLRADQVIE
jgi:putative ABC transport system substrate-binding protein